MLPPNAYGYDLPLDYRLVQQKAVNDNPSEIEGFDMLPPNSYGYDFNLDARLVQ